MSALSAALVEYKPEIAAQYERIVTALFGRMVAKLGPTLAGIGNNWDYAKVWRETVAPVAIKGADGYSIDGARLALVANAYAAAVVESWEGKIAAKLGELDGAKIEKVDGHGFRIAGTRGGRGVEIRQNIIINISRLGTPYNQFPARIRVDGKAVSEAEYKAMEFPVTPAPVTEKAKPGRKASGQALTNAERQRLFRQRHRAEAALDAFAAAAERAMDAGCSPDDLALILQVTVSTRPQSPTAS